ncbi:serine/threonine protein kinase [Mycobacterium lentiflavum]|uniref:non-specific serine/threonine protein kinase n=1 Tax=Mycobacterium lentiflavum TaxID=141349 RepID=A0A0E4H5Z6_MYCLN|nr:serine/threonine-protein kinase [Mycobacterium lentiflavum]CQD24541.1 serine/threonine protein kinase [Mycobacterium lentiflavum]
MPLSEGASFAGYTVVRLLGAGEMGEVYLARHPRLPRLEALKVLRADLSADPNFQKRFIREADRASQLWHPHIVAVHDRGEFSGQLWIAMDYVNGPNLDTVLTQRQGLGLPPAEVLAVVSAVGAALDHAHQLGLLHRDVKPANIMISHPDDGSTPRILLSDFGIARPADDNDVTASLMTDTVKTLGTFTYAAPELLRGATLDGRADQYALAATAYHLLTGVPPFSDTDPISVIHAHLTSPPPRPGNTRPDLAITDVVFVHAMAKDPTQRFPRCSDFAAALTSQLQSPAPGALPLPTSTPPPPQRAPKPRRSRKRLVASAVSALAVVALLVGGGIFAVAKFSGPDAAQRAAQDREAARLVGQHYLEALATGDAQTAVSLSSQQPATPQLLTDKALVDELSATPISAITATNDAARNPDASPDTQRVVLSARFGLTPSQAVITVHKKDGQWKLDTTTIAVTITAPPNSAAAMKALVVAGALTNGASTISVFPGTPHVSSSNRYIDITADTTPLMLEALTAADPPTITPAIALNDVGRQVSLETVDRRAHYCYAGAAPPEGCCPPEGCRQVVTTGPNAIDNDSLNLDSLETTDNMHYDLDANTLRVHVTGVLHYRAHATQQGRPVNLHETIPVDGGVDLSTQPPVFLRRQELK